MDNRNEMYLQMLSEENINLRDKIDGLVFENNLLYCYLQAFQKVSVPMPERVIYSNNATILFDDKGDKTVIKCAKDDDYDLRLGFCLSLLKRIYGKKELDRMMSKFVYETDNYKVLKEKKNGRKKSKKD